MHLRRDTSALESLPLRLMIVCIVACMSILPASEALGTLKAKEFMGRAAQQLKEIASTAELVASQGPGSVRTVSLDFSSTADLQFERLTVGDVPDGPKSENIVLELNNGGRAVESASEPPAALTSDKFRPLVIEAVLFDLRMECVLVNWTEYVVVEVI